MWAWPAKVKCKRCAMLFSLLYATHSSHFSTRENTLLQGNTTSSSLYGPLKTHTSILYMQPVQPCFDDYISHKESSVHGVLTVNVSSS